MKPFNVGPRGPSTGAAPATGGSAAANLVRRTLARHGLSTDLPQGGAAQPTLPSFDSLMARFGSGSEAPVAPEMPLPEGAEFRREVFSCEAGSRAFRIYIPASARAGVTGVVVMLHGCTQTPEDFATGTGMNALAEEHRFVVVYPAQSKGDNAQSCWSWFRRSDQKRDRGEPSILAGLTRKVCAEHGIARDRTFVAGLSAGAAMAVILGETYADVFGAVGAHSGLPYGSAKDVASAFAAMAGQAQDMAVQPGKPSAMRTIVFHGTADATVHPSNGEGIGRQRIAGGAGPAVETSERGQSAGRKFERVISGPAEGVATLETWTIDGLGHAWSGGHSGGSFTDPKGPDASAEMVRFFFGEALQDS